MTDIEMAEGYYNSKFKSNESHFSKYDIEQAFLAGLKADRPKWHKIADGDYPPLVEGCEGVSIRVLDEYGRVIIYDYSSERWRDDEGDHLGIQPAVWCEFPIYTEEIV